MDLYSEIELWDKKSVAIIDDIFYRYREGAGFMQQLVDSLQDKLLQQGGSWLLKKAFENGETLDVKQIQTIYSLLDGFDHWETKLHILQSMGFMPIPAASIQQVEKFLRNCLSDKKKFVRAWAYNGFHLLGEQHVEYRPEADLLLKKGMSEESASVKARIRNILKKK